MMSKPTALKLALVSALLSVLFAYLHVYICLVASFLLLIFDGIWAAKVERDRRLAQLAERLSRPAPVPPTHPNSYRLYIPTA